MMSTLVRRVGVTIAAGVVLGGTWVGTAAASTESTASTTEQAEQVAPAASGRTWCGVEYDPCIYAQELSQHNGYQVSPLYWAGTDNTCIPGHECNGYWFDWWE